MSSTLNPLRPEQRQASTPTDHAWVSASAGTGKTQVLTARVLRLLLAGASPERILCLTFTKAAAAEMQTRIYKRLADWVRADDTRLKADLEALGEAATPELRDDARRLFAKTLDARGGLRIQTLHSFAQSLLASFPVEAGVAPGFATLDDRSGIELRSRALAETLTQAQADGDDGFARDVAELAVRLGEAKLSQLAGRLIAYRDGIAALGHPAGFEAMLRRRLGLPTDASHDEAMAAALSDAAFDCRGLRELAVALGGAGGVTALKAADAIAGWLARGPAERAATFAELHGVFVTKEGSPRKTLVPKKLADADPSLLDLAARLTKACDGVALMARTFELARVAAQHLRVGHRLAAAYQAHKARAGALDFDDMIARAARLLSQHGMADWVRFKLDQSIDHILVDEGQDTNRDQWTIIHAITEEFFAGLGARENAHRTLFAVGDFKQAIFSFQGSDPRVFNDYRDIFRTLAEDAQMRFHDVPLSESFRSTPAVLDVVDRVLDDLGHAALGLHERPARHVPARGDLAGKVVLWPALADPRHGSDSGEASEQSWLLETETEMARRLAAQIRDWLDTPLMLEAKGRAVRPEDILILVRQRREFVTALVANLHAVGVPVAGVDRLRLTEPLAVQDLLALVRFALQPDDDLTLATLLVSPFLGWSQDALFDVAHGREKGVTLWRRLRRRADRDSQAMAAVQWLGQVLALADLLPPYEFFETILSGPLQGRAKLLARLGEEARDSIEAVLAQALAFEASHAPSLQGFLAWIEADDIDLKRDPDAPLDAVRIMTVHGSKGLQAPLVVLADAARDPSLGGDDHVVLEWGPDGEPIPVFFGGKDGRIGPVAQRAAEMEAAAAEEHWRLLYVALTRAEDMLFVGGSLGKLQPAPGPDSWHAKVREALERLDAETVDDPRWGEIRVHARGTVRPPAAKPKPPEPTHAEVPDWALTDPEPESVPPRPLAPSHLAEDDVASPPPSKGAIEAAKRGKLLHALFERLPAVSPEKRLEAAQNWLARQAREMAEQDRDELAYKALAIIDDPDFTDLFGPDALAEAPVAAVVGTTVIAGKVDRLLIAPERIQVVDFKTGLYVPERPEQVSAYHLAQMAAYRAALRRIFPGRTVEAALLFTEVAKLMPLPPELLDRHDRT